MPRRTVKRCPAGSAYGQGPSRRHGAGSSPGTPTPFSRLQPNHLLLRSRSCATHGGVGGDPRVHHIREDEGLRERCYGVFEGLSRAEITERYPDARTSSGGPNPDYTPPGGETPNEFNERIVGTLNRIAHSHAGERVVVVTHGGVVMAFARYVLGVPQDAPRRFDIGNTSLSLFYCDGERDWVARFLGDVSHLEPRGGSAAGHR